ncbi:hypothetical protein [Mycoplasma bradburyae]|uniref:DUF4258 domain-containing protein n=1 Tax=Mycoplasma bradburyae TaxID=2963128 RepID=A0AAW6HS71_9MOLU|nr:hypothetical protein [Mycoplasma bradburyae]MDC4163417.1 hypothetical protein [Mycoplasma bradburyae]MDC4182731.1 hypothetical protein [Mycoplasma bradburyae]MDC4183404.1 hypothetical protein [Mycoplasma bradburyae]MDC4184215.1 hypothetical protein [Mycoplasma bradburyae]UTS71177.1 hypothetical protein NMG77_01805 [Mycoplasma bradburyae]
MYKLTHHSRIRAIQRLVLQEKSDIFIDSEINDILRGILPYYIDKANNGYFEIPKKFLIEKNKRTYAVINLNDNVITTISPISPSKFIKIYAMS